MNSEGRMRAPALSSRAQRGIWLAAPDVRRDRPIQVSRSLAALGMTVLASMIIGTPSNAAAQSVPPAKLAKSIERIYGPGARVDTLHVDSAEVYRVSRDAALLGF